MEEGEVSKESTKFVSVVARACSIVEADLTHSLNLHMDGTGKLGLIWTDKLELFEPVSWGYFNL